MSANPFMVCLGIQPPVDREIRIGNPTLDQPAMGWDILREELWVPHERWIKRGDLRDGPGGPDAGLFVVQDQRVLRYAGGRPVVEVVSHGVAYTDGKDYKISCSGSLAEDLSLASNALGPTIWRIGYPRVTKLWVSLNPPSIFSHVAIADVPDDTFGISASPWGMAWVSATNWAASGWVGESRSVDRLPGSKAGLITDTWLYDPGYGDRDSTPAGVIYL